MSACEYPVGPFELTCAALDDGRLELVAKGYSSNHVTQGIDASLHIASRRLLSFGMKKVHVGELKFRRSRTLWGL